jgi:acyl-CoA synthetase (NDP forming)
MLRVSSPWEMIDLAQGLLMPHPPRGRRVAILGDGGGHVALAADLATERGMRLPLLSDALAADIATTLPARSTTRNPVDLAGGGEQDFFNFDRVVKKLATSGEVDSMLLTGYFGGYSSESLDFARRETEVALAMAATAEETACPLIVQTMYPRSPSIRAMRARRVAVYSDIQSAAQVLARLVERADRPPSGVPPLPEPLTLPPIREGYFEARDMMAGAGIPFVRARQVTTLQEAKAEAAELGFPIVLKALGSSHKSDLRAVKLGIRSDTELEAAFTDIATRLKPPGFSVECMAESVDGIELIVGVRRDPSFGPVVVIGMGGVYAELLDDVAVALAPLSQEVTEQLIRSLRGAPLLLGTRGHPALAISAAAAVAVSLSQLAVERAAITELEINPLLVTPTGVLALDARVVLRNKA